MWANFCWDEGKKKFFEKIKFKMADLKKGHFSKSPIVNIFLRKFYGAVLGLVELIDAKGIGMAQPICTMRLSDIRSKTGQKCIFCVFWPFLSLCRTASRPYRLSHTNALGINEFY